MTTGPPLIGPLGQNPPSRLSVAVQFGSVFALGFGAIGAASAAASGGDVTRGAIGGALIGFALGLPFGVSGWWTA